jgi:TolA-binding protein
MKAQLVAFSVLVAGIALLVLVTRLTPFGRSQKEVELQAKLEAAETVAIDKGKQAILLQKEAAQMQQTIANLQQSLETNQQNTDEKATHVYTIAPDSLAGHVAAQVVALDTTWY